MTIRAILWDADGVVQSPDVERRAAWQALLGNRRDVDAFLGAVFEAERPAWVGRSDFTNALASLLGTWQCVGTLEDAIAAWTMIRPDSDVMGVVRGLRDRGLQCHLASNQESLRAHHMSTVLNYRHTFDREFYSCRMGVAKPSAAYFRAIVQALDLSPESLLFLDDKEVNVGAARAEGFHAARFVLDSGAPHLVRILAGFRVDVV